MPDIIAAQVEGGKASPGPPLGPALGPLGVNIPQIIKEVNAKTKAYEGMVVPVKIIVNPDKTFSVEVGTPPMSALIKKELKLEKGAGNSRDSKAGNLTMDQVIKLAKSKQDSMTARNLANAVQEVCGTCLSMGVTVEGQDPRNIQMFINDGRYDAKLKSQ